MTFRFAGVVFGLALLLPGTASAEGIITWKEVRGWLIAVDPSLGGGCFMGSTFEDGTSFRMGFSRSDSQVFASFGNSKWKSIEPGKDYDIAIRMNGETPWTGTATGGVLDELPTIVIRTDKFDILDEVKRRHSLELLVNDKRAAKLNLEGTSAAHDEMLVCQVEVNKMMEAVPPSAGNDPFAPQKIQPAADPFAT